MNFFFSSLLLLVLLGLAVFLYARFVEPRLLTVRRVDIVSAQLPPEADGLRIVQISDIHVSDDDHAGKLSRLVEAVNAQKPDVLVFTGDLFDNYAAYTGDAQKTAAALAAMEARWGKFAVWGNHDYERSARRVYDQVLTDGGFQLLKDETVPLEELGITVTGLDDFLYGSRSGEALNRIKGGVFRLLLCHEPDAALSLDADAFNLMLSGHTHGGQVKLPVLGIVYKARLGKVYTEGLYDLGGSRGARLYVNRGIGNSMLPLRFLSVPEITVLTLRRPEGT